MKVILFIGVDVHHDASAISTPREGVLRLTDVPSPIAHSLGALQPSTRRCRAGQRLGKAAPGTEWRAVRDQRARL